MRQTLLCMSFCFLASGCATAKLPPMDSCRIPAVGQSLHCVAESGVEYLIPFERAEGLVCFPFDQFGKYMEACHK